MPPAAGIIIDKESFDPQAVGRGHFHPGDRSDAARRADLLSPVSSRSTAVRPFRPLPYSAGRHHTLSDDRWAVGFCLFDAGRAARCRATLS
jgi:hypothetical protein